MRFSTFSQRLGLLRSWLIYYGHPLRRRQLRRFYAQFIEPGALCFDVGAHLGNRVQAWLDCGARVVALDPQPICFEFLQKKFGQHSDVVILGQGVAAAEGATTLHISSRHPTVTSASRGWIDAVQRSASFAGVAWDTAVEIELITLDALREQYGEPAFVKIDVEGYELEVLRGLSRPIAALSFEFLPQAIEMARACLKRLEELGRYRYNWTLGEQHQWQSERWLTPAEMGDQLSELAANGRSGDIYAALNPPAA